MPSRNYETRTNNNDHLHLEKYAERYQIVMQTLSRMSNEQKKILKTSNETCENYEVEKSECWLLETKNSSKQEQL